MKKVGIFPISLLLILSIVPTVMGGQTGGIRIDPPLPTPSVDGEFTISVIPSAVPTYHPHILLVITDSCKSTIGDVSVTWTGGGTTISSWNSETVPSVKVPPSATTGAGYTVASLMDHLETSGTIWWACTEILEAPIGEDSVDITVSFTSDDPRMLVYIMGSSSPNNPVTLDTRVPPTIPGFVIPELPLGTITAIASMMVALILVARKRPTILR